VPDNLIVKYFRLVTDVAPDEVDAIAAGLADAALHPGETKRRLAREIVTLFHSPQAARAAEERFNIQFRDRGIPADVPEFDLGDTDPWPLPRLLVESGLVASTSEARRHVAQGAVRLDGDVLTEPTAELAASDLRGRVLQVGRRRFVRLRGG
jgi:tyrosyl-tRNA synthetase